MSLEHAFRKAYTYIKLQYILCTPYYVSLTYENNVYIWEFISTLSLNGT